MRLLAPALALACAGCGAGGEAAVVLKAGASSAVAPRGDPRDERPPQRPEFEALADALTAGDNPFLGRGERRRLEEALAGGALAGPQRLQVMSLLADECLQHGDEQRAVELLQEVVAEARASGDRGFLGYGLARLSVAWLRLAEVQNCIARHQPECCLFPLQGGALHTEREPASRARETLLEYLSLDPGNLQAVWLLNVSAMALGEWPDGVPESYRLPERALRSEQDVGRFRDVAPALGLDTFSLCGGAIVDDLDGDGRLDVLTSSYEPRTPLSFHRNVGDGTFDDVSEGKRATDQLGGLNLVGADYDGDGDLDVLVLRGAWLYDDGRMRNSLLRNEGDGTLVDVTDELGLARPARPTQAAVWGDFDNEGDLDLFVGNESRMPADPRGDYPCQLFRNDGEQGFVDVAPAAGVTNDSYCKGAAAGDYDDDGDLDLYVSNVGSNRLYRNDGELTFTDVAHGLGVAEPSGRSFATWFFDHDNDGRLDLFVAGFAATVADLAAEALGRPHGATLPRLYRNTGTGFADVTAEVGLARPFLPMGASFGDLDHDGWLDIYLGTGDPSFETLMPNVLLRNDGGRRYVDVTVSAGMGHLQKGHGVAFADIDDDGDQDVFNQLGGFYPADAYHDALFLNPGHGNRFVYVELVGVQSPRSGYGARLAVHLRTPDGPRALHRAVGSVSSFGGAPRRQEIGCGDALAIERLEVTWPVSGERQVFNDVPLDGMIRITEGSEHIERLPLRPIPLAAGR